MCLYNASIYRDESGNIAGVFAAARDITKLKSAQRELENTNHEILMLGQMADLLQSCHSAGKSHSPLSRRPWRSCFRSPPAVASSSMKQEAFLRKCPRGATQLPPKSISRPMIAGLCVGDTCTALDSGSSYEPALQASPGRECALCLCAVARTRQDAGHHLSEFLQCFRE